MEVYFLQPYDMTSQHPVSAYKYIHTSYLYHLSRPIAVLLEWRASFPWPAPSICHHIPEFCFSWWPLILMTAFHQYCYQRGFPGVVLPRTPTMLWSGCYTASYHTTNTNHLKEKKISIIVEIPRFFILSFLCIWFFPHYQRHGILPYFSCPFLD